MKIISFCRFLDIKIARLDYRLVEEKNRFIVILTLFVATFYTFESLYTKAPHQMKNKSIHFAIFLVIFASALAFTYLNFCSIPLEIYTESSLQDVEKVTNGSASLGDIKIIEIILEKLVAVFTTL